MENKNNLPEGKKSFLSDKPKLKELTEKLKKNRTLILSVGMIAVICLLLITVIVLGSSLTAAKAHINTTHATIQNRALYTISSARNLADTINKPGADVPGTVLPGLERTLSTLEELNSLLANLYGSDAQIADSSLMTKINASLYELQKCYTTGKPSDAQLETLYGYLTELVNTLNYYS